MQFGGAAQLVEPQAAVHQPFEWLAQAGLVGQVRAALRGRKPAFACVLEPRADDLSMLLDLVEIVSAQTFVAQAGDALQHELIGRSEERRVGSEGRSSG